MTLDASNRLARLAGPAVLANGASAVFTGTVGHIYTIKRIRIVNPTAGAISISLGVGGTANANLILPPTVIDANGFADSDDFVVLAGVETLNALTTAVGLTITIFGLDQS